MIDIILLKKNLYVRNRLLWIGAIMFGSIHTFDASDFAFHTRNILLYPHVQSIIPAFHFSPTLCAQLVTCPSKKTAVKMNAKVMKLITGLSTTGALCTSYVLVYGFEVLLTIHIVVGSPLQPRPPLLLVLTPIILVSRIAIPTC